MEILGGKVNILIGDVRDKLRELPSDHFDCVVTSPPYWGLRDYGVAGQIGLERTLGEHLDVMVTVFEEVRRVLKPTGTLWLNYGDCYATSPNGRSAADTKAVGGDDRTFRDKPFSTIGAIYSPNHHLSDRRGQSPSQNRSNGQNLNGAVVASGNLKPKDLCMIPNRLAIALQEAGWWVRSEIIWHKPNPMPESTRDRPTSSHEKIWLMTKRERYYYDADAIAETASVNTHSRVKMPDGWDTSPGGHGSHHRNGREKGKTNGTIKEVLSGRPGGRKPEDFDPLISGAGRSGVGEGLLTRNSRNVWTIGTAAFSEAHFATFPPELAERCIKAGSPAGGSILDPFGGAGTTGLVAASLGRTATLIELNQDYAKLAKARLEAAFMGKDEGSRHMVKQLGKETTPGPLFDALFAI